jgi:hypothetical protein
MCTPSACLCFCCPYLLAAVRGLGRGGAKETLENQIKRSSNLIDSLELKIANHDSTLTLRDKDIVNLRAQLDAAKDSKLPKQIQTITDFMYNATGKDGSTLVNYVQYMKPALGDSAGDLASRLLNTACLALQTFGESTAGLQADLKAANANKGGGGKTPSTNPAPSDGKVDCSQCPEKIKTITVKNEQYVTFMNQELKKLKGDSYGTGLKFKMGDYGELNEMEGKIPSSIDKQKANNLLTALTNICDCIVKPEKCKTKE